MELSAGCRPIATEKCAYRVKASFHVFLEIFKRLIKIRCDPKNLVFRRAGLAGPGFAFCFLHLGQWYTVIGDRDLLTWVKVVDDLGQFRLGFLDSDGGHVESWELWATHEQILPQPRHAVGVEFRINADDGNVFREGLGYKQAVEGVFVVQR